MASIAESSESATSDASNEEVESAVGEVTDGGTKVDVAESHATGADRTSPDSLQQSSRSTSGEHSEREDSSSISADDIGELDRPAYKDPERLADMYDSDRTFAEMTEELGVDVTPKTVRNHMVKHGIHDPDTKPESSSGDDGDSFLEEPENNNPVEEEIAAEIAEEIELPDDITLSNVTDAVCTAKTLYKVQRELGIDRDQTHRILTELNLLELVHGRLSTTSTQSRSREEVEDRIKEAVTNTAIAE